MYGKLVLIGAVLTIGGCGTNLSGANLGSVAGMDVGTTIDAASKIGKAVTLSDTQVKASAAQLREYEEQTSEQVAANSDPHSQRLEKLTATLQNYDGMNLNYKVYVNQEVNANATADGSVRVYTGLMDMMDDAEMMFVIGHEIGHVKHGHTLKAMRTELALRGVREGAAASGSALGALAAGEMGGLLEAVVNAQFSQSQETQSDDYGLQFLRASGHKPQAAASALRKLAQLNGGQHTMLSSHPEPTQRAERMAQLAQQ